MAEMAFAQGTMLYSTNLNMGIVGRNSALRLPAPNSLFQANLYTERTKR